MGRPAVDALAAARAALAELLKRLDNSEGHYDSVFFVVKDMLAHLTEQEQTEHGFRNLDGVQSDGGDHRAHLAHTEAQAVSEVETLLMFWEGQTFGDKGLRLMAERTASALRASETAKQQAEQERDKLKAILFDPHVLRVNMLRGEIPKLADIEYADRLAVTVEKLESSLSQREAEIARLLARLESIV